jgi:hypothetical protein
MSSPEISIINDTNIDRKTRMRKVLLTKARKALGRQGSEHASPPELLIPRIIQPERPEGRIEQRARTVAARQKEGLIRTPHALAVQEAMKADRKRSTERLAADRRMALALIDYMREVNDPFVSREMSEFINAIRTNYTGIQREGLDIYAFIQPDNIEGRKYVYSFALAPTTENEDVTGAAQTANEVTRAYFASKYIEYNHEIADKHKYYYAETTFEDASLTHQDSPLAIQNCYHVIPAGNGRMIEVAIATIPSNTFAANATEAVLINRSEPFNPIYSAK